LLKIKPADWEDDTGRDNLERFKLEVIERMADPPWNSDVAKQNGITVCIY